MKMMPSMAAAAPPRAQWIAPIQASSKKKVMWIRTVVGPTSNNLIDQPMLILLKKAARRQQRFAVRGNSYVGLPREPVKLDPPRRRILRANAWPRVAAFTLAQAFAGDDRPPTPAADRRPREPPAE